ncbi:MAG: hypothetical protein AAGG44_14705, partial [Planctomycetota bacterium]
MKRYRALARANAESPKAPEEKQSMYRNTAATWTRVCIFLRHGFFLALAGLFAFPSDNIAWSQTDDQEPEGTQGRAGNAQVAEVMKTFVPRGVQADDTQPTPPQESLDSFTSKPGVAIDLVAAEPTISQPLHLSWDSRGRMWVVQYRQYQFPAGLKIVRYDHHLRAVFDKTPEPPPNGTPGEDRITVFEDT